MNNPLEEFAIDLMRKFKQLKTFDEGDGFRYIGLAQSCTLDAKLIMRQITQYVKAAEQSDGIAGDLELNGKTIMLPTDVELTTVAATYIGDVSSSLLINITSVADVLEGVNSPYTLDLYVSEL